MTAYMEGWHDRGAGSRINSLKRKVATEIAADYPIEDNARHVHAALERGVTTPEDDGWLVQAALALRLIEARGGKE